MLLAINFSAFCWIKVVQTDKGLFGYKYVNEDHAGPNHSLSCSQPGHQKCRFKESLIFNGDETGDQFVSDVLLKVDEILSQSDTNGYFYYNSDCYVRYNYNPENDSLVVEIYTKKEARDLGLI